MIIKENKMNHTMRSAFKRWLILHDEEFRTHRYIRIPHQFRHYIRNTKKWKYTIINKQSDYYCNIHNLNDNQRRMYKGYYTFDIDDEELMNLQRPEYTEGEMTI